MTTLNHIPHRKFLSAQSLGAGLLALLCAAPVVAIDAGEPLVVTGFVTDAEGNPLPGLRVVLQAARVGFSVRDLSMTTGRTTTVDTLTGSDGSYELQWTFDPFYNHFEIRAVLPPSKEAGEPRILLRRELTDRIRLGSPVVANLTITEADEIARVRQFEASIDTDDEERIFARHGRPDHIRTVNYPEVEETSWWYFEDGVVYYLRSGTLVESRRFEPVRPE